MLSRFLPAALLCIALPLHAGEPLPLDRERVRQQALEVEIGALLREAEAAAGRGDFAAALRRLKAAELSLAGLPAEPREGLSARAAALRAAWEPSAREAAALGSRARAAEAEEALGRELAERRERREEGRRRLLERFSEAASRGRYAEAERLLRDAEALDPAAPSLDALRERLAELRHGRIGEGLSASAAEEWRNVREFADEQAIPYAASILRYPDAWNRTIRRRQSMLAGAQEQEEAWRAALREKLAGKVHCRFDGLPFPDALAALESQGRTVINVDAAARGLVPDLDARTVTLRTPEGGMSLEHALAWLLQGTGLVWSLADEAVRISTPEGSQEPPVLERHDVRDILAVPIDSPGPGVSLGQEGGIKFEETAVEEASFTGEDLLAFLKEYVQPSAWNDPRHAISYRNGALLVNAPPAIQRQVRDVLNGFRGQRTLQVLIQARFITLNDISLEAMGVDWKGLSNNVTQGNFAGGGNSLTVPTTPATTPSSVPRPGFVNGITPDVKGVVSNQGNFLTSAFPRTFNGLIAAAGGLGLEVAFLDAFQAQMVLEMVEKSSKADLLTAPSLLCFNTQRANMVSMVQQAYIEDITAVVQVQAVGYDPEIGYVQAGIVFDVRPIVSADRKYITLELRPTVSQLQQIRTVFTSGAITTAGQGQQGGPQQNIFVEAPVVQMTTLRTTVSVPDGGTLLIGGLTNSDETRQHAAVPFLSKIPFLQVLFSSKADARNRQSLVVLMKAQIVDQREMEEERFGKP